MAPQIKNYRRVNPDHYHDVSSNARGLSVLYTVEIELTRLLGGWIPRLPEFPEKLTLAEMVYEESEHARMLEDRLLELRLTPSRTEELRRRTTPALRSLEATESPAQFLAGVFRVVKPALLADLRRHADASPPYVDTPTTRILDRIISEEEGHIAAGLSLLAEREVDWEKTAAFEEQLPEGLWDVGQPDRGFRQGEFVGMDPIPLPRPNWPEAVEQIPATESMPDWPEDYDGAMQRCVHELVFSELEALDIFGRYIYEFHDFPWDFYVESARLCWDEARHVELLLNVLERYDGEVGQFPANAPGYEEFVAQPTVLQKIMMVNVIAEGEYSTDTQTQHREAFKQLGDELSALLKDYEMADEIVHGRFGMKWARWLADEIGEDFNESYQQAKRSLAEFKAKHAEEADEDEKPPIPLVRLGLDETKSTRLVNASAKRLAGFSDEEIEAMTAEASEVIEED